MVLMLIVIISKTLKTKKFQKNSLDGIQTRSLNLTKPVSLPALLEPDFLKPPQS